MPKIKPPTYQEFIKLWEKLNERNKNKIFYFSLFDMTSSFEDDVKIAVMKSVEKRLMDLIKKTDKSFYKKFCHDKGKFLCFVSADTICKYIIASELEKCGVKIDRKILFQKQSYFSDIRTIDKQFIEIKRLVSGANVRNIINDEVIGRIESLTEDITSFILILIFPSLPKDERIRVDDLIKGFYFIEDYLNKQMQISSSVLIQYIDEDVRSEEYSLNELISRIKTKVLKA